MVQPVQMAFQQQIQTLKTQHEEFVSNLKQQSGGGPQLAPQDSDAKTPAPMAPQPGEEGTHTHTHTGIHTLRIASSRP